MADTVLDASALLAALLLEPGHEFVREHGRNSVISTVNLSEAYARGQERGASSEAVATVLGLMSVEVRAFDHEDAQQAAALRPPTRRLGISFADRACLALGQRLALPVLTGDRRWAELDIGVEVRLIR